MQIEFTGFDDEAMDSLIRRIQGRLSNIGNNPTDKDIVESFDSNHDSASLNVIPSESLGSCHPILVVSCMGKPRLLDERLREMVYHVGINCAGQSRKVLLVTSCWSNDIYEKHRKVIEEIKRLHHLKIFKMQLEGGRFVHSVL